MRLIINYTLVRPELVLERRNGEVLIATDSKVFTGFYERSCESMFEPLNAYWRSLSAGALDTLENLYFQVGELLPYYSEELSDLETQDKLRFLMQEILSFHDYETMKQVVAENVNRGIIDTSEFTHDYNGFSEESTYNKVEYFELMALTMMFKPFAIIWLKMLSQARQSVGSFHKEASAFGLVLNDHIENLPPYQKLLQYTVSTTEKTKTANMASITELLSSDDIPLYYIASAVVRRMAPFQFFVFSKTDPASKTLVSLIFKLYADKRKEFERGPGNKEKREDKSVTSEEMTPADTYRISERVASAFITMASDYINGDIEKLKPKFKAYSLLTENDKKVFNEIYIRNFNTVVNHKKYSETMFHRAFFQLIAEGIVRSQKLMLIPLPERFKITALVATFFELLNLPTLGKLLISEHTASTSIIIQSPLMNKRSGTGYMLEIRPELKEELLRAHSYTSPGGRTANEATYKQLPSIVQINNTAKVVIANQWSEIDEENLANFRNEYAELFILYFKGVI